MRLFGCNLINQKLFSCPIPFFILVGLFVPFVPHGLVDGAPIVEPLAERFSCTPEQSLVTYIHFTSGVELRFFIKLNDRHEWWFDLIWIIDIWSFPFRILPFLNSDWSMTFQWLLVQSCLILAIVYEFRPFSLRTWVCFSVLNFWRALNMFSSNLN